MVQISGVKCSIFMQYDQILTQLQYKAMKQDFGYSPSFLNFVGSKGYIFFYHNYLEQISPLVMIRSLSSEIEIIK